MTERDEFKELVKESLLSIKIVLIKIKKLLSNILEKRLQKPQVGRQEIFVCAWLTLLFNH